LTSETQGSLRYSVVVPVFNEHETIAAFCRTARGTFPPGYEILICYDFEEDTTLEALAALGARDKPEAVRLIHNRLGPGVRFAIEAGMRAARAPLVVVTMVDLSDDYRILPEMLQRAQLGAAVVCASRYMRGGSQVGGPRVKGLLSRLAGTSLHLLAGLPTHDPTNSFKVYRKDFLDSTVIESSAGFSLALELTAKAHFGGSRVEEVPATWRHREAGRSRFRLLRWLPGYLRWYLWALSRAAVSVRR
jgi:glycosyltransferase involved in cell wall biosynthesis